METKTAKVGEAKLRSDVRRVQLDLVEALDRVCHRHGLRYYLAYGTCLGAMRHGGFIPWDDDIDVLMPIADVLKLIEYQSELGARYFVQTKDTDPDHRTIAARLRDSETTAIEWDTKDLSVNKGIYVDVYPFYEAADNRFLRTLDILRSHLYKLLVNNRPPVHHGGAAALVSKALLWLYRGKRRERAIARIERRLRSVRGKEILDYYGQDVTLLNAITYPKEWFGTPRRVPFEDRMFDAPTEPEQYLSKRYGDWRTPPPEGARQTGFSYLVIDPYRSYRTYETED